MSRVPGERRTQFDARLSRSLTSDIPGTAQERRCFEFFRTRTVSQLSGFDSGLWHQLILQVSHCEPAIRHAAVALGSLHQKFIFDQPSALGSKANLSPDEFATQQYTKAIGFLVQPIRERGEQAADVALMACVLFVLFEVGVCALLDQSASANKITDFTRAPWISPCAY